jgi:ADP-heptose:LPS heptosyltransferase
MLVASIRERHPDTPIRLFVNPGNAGAEAFTSQGLPDGCELRGFRNLRSLVAEYLELAAWYGTDTGLYHLAVAMGIPATVFFGPTQPHKIIMPAQSNVRVHRLAALGERHCEVKSCRRPACLHGAVATFAGRPSATSLNETPHECPLRAMGSEVPRELADLSPA